MILVLQAIIKSIGVFKMNNQGIAHVKWNCTYHIVSIPKYRREIMFEKRKRLDRNHKELVPN